MHHVERGATRSGSGILGLLRWLYNSSSYWKEQKKSRYFVLIFINPLLLLCIKYEPLIIFHYKAHIGTLKSLTNLNRFSVTSTESMRDGTQLVSSVQSAWRPQLQPVENREKSQVSFLPGL